MSQQSYFQELLKLKHVSTQPLTYESITLPVRAGNALPIAYGGYTTALSVQAAFHSLKGSDEDKDTWSLYSATGIFLGPTMLKIPVRFAVTQIRDTRSFTTRFVKASQEIKGQSRDCFCVTIDFVKKLPSEPPHRESRLPLSYSLAPPRELPPPEECIEIQEDIKVMVKSGDIPGEVLENDTYNAMFGIFKKVSENYLIKGDILRETLFGVVPKLNTAQQRNLPDLTQRRSADYLRAKETLKPISPSDGALPMTARSVQASFISFMIDGAIAFYPLVESGLGFSDYGACSSLDFAFRLHDDDYDFSQLHLREMRTYCGDRQRTFNEALVWNLEGKLIASVTQQSVLRPKSDPNASKL